MITHTPPLAGYLLIKTLVTKQQPTTTCITYTLNQCKACAYLLPYCSHTVQCIVIVLYSSFCTSLAFAISLPLSPFISSSFSHFPFSPPFYSTTSLSPSPLQLGNLLPFVFLLSPSTKLLLQTLNQSKLFLIKEHLVATEIIVYTFVYVCVYFPVTDFPSTLVGAYSGVLTLHLYSATTW